MSKVFKTEPGRNLTDKNMDVEFLHPYLALTYLFLLVNNSVFLLQVEHTSFIKSLFLAVVYISHSFLFLVPIILFLEGLKKILYMPFLSGISNKAHINPKWILYCMAILLTWSLQVLIFTDGFIFRIYSFHINSFVWNLVFTRGGIESMGGDSATFITFCAILSGFLILQSLLLLLLLQIKPIKRFCLLIFNKRRLSRSIITLMILMLLQNLTYGVSKLYAYTPILNTSDVFPLYLPLTFNKLAKSIGIEPRRAPGFRMKTQDRPLRYPLDEIKLKPTPKKYNIVWLVAESLRVDMLDPKIMPATWAFSGKALRFENHYGGSNGTRQSMFAMFYGLYGNYWFSFLKERRGPVIMDILLRQGYQMQMFSSASFSYPEFDLTIFSQVPRKLLHDASELPPGASWEHDRENVTRMLHFIQKREPERPFMAFMFFESPHARYYFPPENVIRKPYLEDFNYATMDLEQDIGLIKNRYINSCNHLDSQFNSVLKYLEDHGLLDSTIVILAGDHGEEFMEKGHWGHNSTFNEEQTRTPLVLWVPGMTPRKVTDLTCHLDIPATLLPLLGVVSPAADYSLGFNLLDAPARSFTILGDWYKLAYVDREYKAIFKHRGISSNTGVTTKSDEDVESPAFFFKSREAQLLRIIGELARFSK